jgi:hypothetical protein
MTRKYQPTTRYEFTTHVAVVLLLLILFVSVGYFFFLGKPDEHALRLELAAALETSLATWERQRPGAFRYVVDRSCDCPKEDSTRYIVTSRGGQREAEFPIPVESSAGIFIMVPPNPVWIEDIFGLAEEAVASGLAIEARYHQRYGFPEFVVIKPDEGAPGTFEKYEIRDFEAL